jgi:hypothetical protein
MTPLDVAHAAAEDAPEDEEPRLRLYACLADTELFVLLEEEPRGDDPSPRVFQLDEGPFVMAFDREERLAAFTGAPAAYAALPGRVVAAQLARADIGLGLNLGVAPSSMLLPTSVLAWLTELLAAAPVEALARPVDVFAPARLPDPLMAALQSRMAALAGLAERAVLAAVRYADDRRGHVLAFLGARPEAEAALAKAVSEALLFSGVEAGEIDVIFPETGSRVAARIISSGQDLGLPTAPQRGVEDALRAAPGMDPTKPPILR